MKHVSAGRIGRRSFSSFASTRLCGVKVCAVHCFMVFSEALTDQQYAVTIKEPE
jgi:hypothetical protein